MKPVYSTLPALLLLAAIQDANALIVASPDSASVVKGGSVTINVLANDSHNDSNGGDLRIYTYPEATAYGSIVLNNDNTLTYTPFSADYVGTDTFSYRPRNNVSYGGDTLVTVTVTDAPVVAPPDDDLAANVTSGRNKAVAGMLDDICFSENETSGVSNACRALFAEIDNQGNNDNLNKIISEIAPDEALTQRQLLAQNARNNTSNIYRSMALLRSETTGSTSLSINNVTLPSGGGAGDGFGSPWTLLSSVQVDKLERDLTANEAGYDSKGMSLMLGLGYRLDTSLNIGAALDWTHYDVDYINKSGTLDSDTYNLTGFLSWYKGPLSLDLQAGYSAGQSDAQRLFTFPTAAFADSSYDSSQLSLSTRIEWAWQSGALALKPFLRVDYLDTDIDGYSETGNSIWLMQAGKQSQEQTNASVGLDSSYTLTYSWGVLTPNLKMSLVNQDNLGSDPVAFHLLNAGSTAGKFQLQTDALDKQFYQWELNSVMVLKNGLSAFIAVQTLSDYDNISSRRISAGLNREF